MKGVEKMFNQQKVMEKWYEKNKCSKGVANQKLADLLGVTERTVANYKNGDTTLSATSLGLIANELGYTPNYFYEKEN